MKKLKVLSMVFLMAMGFMAIRPITSYAQDNAMMGNMSDNSKAEVAISGFCPVCLIQGMKMKGSDNFTTEYKGKIYKFANIEMQKAFLENPEEYTKDLEAKFKQM